MADCRVLEWVVTENPALKPELFITNQNQILHGKNKNITFVSFHGFTPVSVMLLSEVSGRS